MTKNGASGPQAGPVSASKEACTMALVDVGLLRAALPEASRGEHQQKLDYLEAFLRAAEKRLPTAAAIARDKARKRNARARKAAAQKRKAAAANGSGV